MLLQDCLVMLRVLFSRHTGQLKSFTIHLIIQIKVSDGLKAWQPFLSARPKHSLWSSRIPLAALSDSHMMFNLDSLWSWWKGINAWKEIVKLMPCYFKSITYSWVKGCWEHMGFMSSRETDLPTCVCVCGGEWITQQQLEMGGWVKKGDYYLNSPSYFHMINHVLPSVWTIADIQSVYLLSLQHH